MEQISFYLDEHIHRAVVEGLRRRGVNVLTVQEAGRSGLSDSEQLRQLSSAGVARVSSTPLGTSDSSDARSLRTSNYKLH